MRMVYFKRPQLQIHDNGVVPRVRQGPSQGLFLWLASRLPQTNYYLPSPNLPSRTRLRLLFIYPSWSHPVTAPHLLTSSAVSPNATIMASAESSNRLTIPASLPEDIKDWTEDHVATFLTENKERYQFTEADINVLKNERCPSQSRSW